MTGAARDPAPRENARALAERVARRSYGRLVAWLTAQFGDVTLAEDALSDAFTEALRTWPDRGPPDRPEAWLAAVARRKLLSEKRRAATAARLEPALALIEHERAAETAAGVAAAPDYRLALMAALAHPAAPAALHAPLMAQTVLGFEAADLASAHLVSPSAMAQRLVRAKRALRESGALFEMAAIAPPERLGAVLEAVYTAFGLAWNDRAPAHHGRTGQETEPPRPRGRALAEEALHLGRLIVEQQPESAEAQGLLALMLYAHARRDAQRDAAGRYIPLEAQNPTQWSAELMDEADASLARANTLPGAGRFQLEAAIQSLHAARRLADAPREPPWRAITLRYEALLNIAPSAGVITGAAAAIAKDRGAAAAMRFLDLRRDPQLERYQPYWATRAEVARRLGSREAVRAEAVRAYELAIGLTEDPAVRSFLLERQRGL
ncbi:MAG: DUF6596 domain-containing protein [Pseudomonadota bacterium]